MTFPQSDFPRPGSPVRAYLLESQLDVWAPHGVCTGREVPTQKCFGSAELDSLLLISLRSLHLFLGSFIFPKHSLSLQALSLLLVWVVSACKNMQIS